VDVRGLGVDVVDVSRIEGLLARRPRFADHVFSPEEIQYCDGRGDGRAACYAARWAAREACAKALGGVPGGRWREIRVTRAEDGSVGIDLDGRAGERASELGVGRILLSMAHERGTAMACCIALGG
jgi:holo-[acyl-carrier protein] synthase